MVEEVVEYRFRPATSDDDAFVYGLHRAAMGAVVEATWGPWDEAVQRGFHERSFSPERLRIVLVGDVEAGVVDAGFETPTVFYIGRIEILPRFQGVGLGSRILRDLLAAARRRGAAAAELHVLKANRARSLYERLGFVVIADEDPKFRMRLELPDAGDAAAGR
ncbi:GNAT family N-acetyltransferase [Kribbella capetownensis]|uniref:GNAT family N-acetyltransferase n=1 Tax=Kribbella capetownensis TaxID=1572659 RepID=A0A4V2M6T7_9ACTN|nr:GNAT family N-acetyltransferase [Kribbella capetownensis]TCC44992.1 GNAT family N-acetyltransferase [Kribbella capetownensis]